MVTDNHLGKYPIIIEAKDSGDEAKKNRSPSNET